MIRTNERTGRMDISTCVHQPLCKYPFCAQHGGERCRDRATGEEVAAALAALGEKWQAVRERVQREKEEAVGGYTSRTMGDPRMQEAVKAARAEAQMRREVAECAGVMEDELDESTPAGVDTLPSHRR